MKFNKLTMILILVLFGNSVEFVSGKTGDYQGKKIENLYMNMLNTVLVKFPTTTLRMTMAAERGQKVVNDIAELKPIKVRKSGVESVLFAKDAVSIDEVKALAEAQGAELVYFEKSEDETAYVKKQLEYVLAPVEKFMEDIKEQRNIVKKLLEVCLGVEKAKSSLITTALDVEGSFLAFFSKTVTKISELNEAATEFLMFFADVQASLSVPAKDSFEKLKDKIRNNKKQGAIDKENNKNDAIHTN